MLLILLNYSFFQTHYITSEMILLPRLFYPRLDHSSSQSFEALVNFIIKKSFLKLFYFSFHNLNFNLRESQWCLTRLPSKLGWVGDYCVCHECNLRTGALLWYLIIEEKSEVSLLRMQVVAAEADAREEEKMWYIPLRSPSRIFTLELPRNSLCRGMFSALNAMG